MNKFIKIITIVAIAAASNVAHGDTIGNWVEGTPVSPDTHAAKQAKEVIGKLPPKSNARFMKGETRALEAQNNAEPKAPARKKKNQTYDVHPMEQLTGPNPEVVYIINNHHHYHQVPVQAVPQRVQQAANPAPVRAAPVTNVKAEEREVPVYRAPGLRSDDLGLLIKGIQSKRKILMTAPVTAKADVLGDFIKTLQS